MDSIINYFRARISLDQEDIDFLNKLIVPVEVPARTLLLEAGKTEQYVYFLRQGIVKGYQRIDGKIIVGHLIDESNFFSSVESFMNEIPSLDCFETVTDCKLCKISKPDFDLLRDSGSKWRLFIEHIINEHLICKMTRIKDFQTLTAKERYLKFLKNTPHLALNVSIDNIASFLGIEPQSLSRIRKQITA